MTLNRREFFMAIAATVGSATLRPPPAIAVMLDESRVPTGERIAKIEALREYQFYIRNWQYDYEIQTVADRIAGKPQRMRLDLALTNGDLTVYTESFHEEPSPPRSWTAIHDAWKAMQPVKLKWKMGTGDYTVEDTEVNIRHFDVCRMQIDVTSLGDEARRYVYGLRTP